MNPNISPNQFALPGMEEHAHPGAPYLPKGITFTHSEEKGTWRYADPASRGQGHGFHSHYLYAHKMGAAFDPEKHHGNALGHIQWAGQHATQTGQGSHYPGEIEYVERAYGAERHKGLMTALYRIGHEMNVGQTTVPTHSPTRTPEGEEWSAKVGGPRPEQGDYDWRPPTGIHPYEKQARVAMDARNAKRRSRAPGPGQGQFPGMSRADEIWRGLLD